jgi:hypothetical protein
LHNNSDVKVAFYLGLSLLCFYLLTAPAHRPYGDEQEYLAVAENILIRGELSITKIEPNPAGQPRDIVTYSKFSLGQSILLLPFVTAELVLARITPAAQLIVYVLPALESAAICGLVFLLIRVIGKMYPDLDLSRRAALLLAAMTALATQLWPSAHTLFADQSAAFLLTFAVYAVVRLRYEERGLSWGIVSAWASALAVLCKTIFIVACPAVAIYVTWAAMTPVKSCRRFSQREITFLIAMALVPFVLVGILQLWHNDLRYGSIWTFGYREGRDGEYGFATPLLVGLYGLLFSSGRSLLLYSPLCLLALVGARDFFKRAPPETALMAGVSLPLLLVYAKWWSWHGGWEWGTRFYLFLIPVLMWLSIPAWRWLDKISASTALRRVKLFSLGVLFTLSVCIQLLGVLIHPLTYWLLLANEVKIMEQPVYRKGAWEIRDDMLLPHFVPEFSPLAGHAWLAWATWNREKLDENALALSAPWVSLNPKWVPKNVYPYLGYDLWFVTPAESAQTQSSRVLSRLLFSGALIAGIVFCVFKLKLLTASAH